MAIITTSSLITNIVGSIGGTTFQNNPAGLIARRRPPQRKSFSPAQAMALSKTGTIAQQWQAIPNDFKLLFDTYAATYTKTSPFGRAKKLTGYQWFYSMNYYNDIWSLTYTEVPPAHIAVPAYANFSAILDNTQFKIFATPPVGTGPYYGLLFASTPTPLNSQVPTTKLRFINYLPTTVATGFDINAAYNQVFSINPETLDFTGNWRIMLKAVVFDTQSRLYGPAAYYNVITSQTDVGIGLMQIGSTFIVR